MHVIADSKSCEEALSRMQFVVWHALRRRNDVDLDIGGFPGHCCLTLAPTA